VILNDVMMVCVCVPRYSQFTVNAADGLKLKSRAARFADTLGTSASPKIRMEPLTLPRPNVSFL